VQRYLGREAAVLHPPVRTDAFRWLGDDGVFVSTARIAPLKRVEAIVRAFLKMPDQRLVVLSGGSDAQRLQRLAAGAPNIRFTGWVSDAERSTIIGRCRATLYVPVDEDFGISPVESMAAGKPVIGVREGGLRETVLHERTGLLLAPDFTHDDLCDAVRAMSAERARAMRAACELQADEFSEPRFRTRLLSLLQPVPRPAAPAHEPAAAGTRGTPRPQPATLRRPLPTVDAR
jgi:glycosyltransferase involved in cell wall biosynthesis